MLTLYDPDRAQAVLRRGQISTWNAFLTTMHSILEDQRLKDGAGAHLAFGTDVTPPLSF